MARDANNKVIPLDARGRRSVSQRSRDLSEKLGSLGKMFDGAPQLLESIMTGTLIVSFVYFLRPRIEATVTADPDRYVFFRGRHVSEIKITYPDRAMARNLAVLAAIVVGRPTGGEIGSLLFPAAAAGFFAQAIEKTFPNDASPTKLDLLGLTFSVGGETAEKFTAYDLAFGPLGNIPGGPGAINQDVTLNFYRKVIFPRYVRAIFFAAFLYFILRFVRTSGI
jgi:hypothetical protein